MVSHERPTAVVTSEDVEPPQKKKPQRPSEVPEEATLSHEVPFRSTKTLRRQRPRTSMKTRQVGTQPTETNEMYEDTVVKYEYST